MPLRTLYNFLLKLTWWGLHVVALFSSKIDLFVKGRKETKQLLNKSNFQNDKFIWMHVASLGEFEQGLPILEKLKIAYPRHKLILTFFSPSGYEVKKNSGVADYILYLPMDTKSNVQQFLDAFPIDLAIFVKYEIWPNFLRELKERRILTFLVSAIFSQGQVYFKPWGGFMRKSLKAFDHFFVQDIGSKTLLQEIGFTNTTVSGDTRFDRVAKILDQHNAMDFMDGFKSGQLCCVAGSTWPEDEEILVNYINATTHNIKFVLAPHTIKPSKIDKLKASLEVPAICYSEINDNELSSYQVLIVDTIGLLTKIYSYANIAYVGGAFATGLHNTLEPAVFGVPVIIGPDYSGFKEAEDLVALKGIHTVQDKAEFKILMDRFVTDSEYRESIGKINTSYIQKNLGATDSFMKTIKKVL